MIDTDIILKQSENIWKNLVILKKKKIIESIDNTLKLIQANAYFSWKWVPQEYLELSQTLLWKKFNNF